MGRFLRTYCVVVEASEETPLPFEPPDATEKPTVGATDTLAVCARLDLRFAFSLRSRSQSKARPVSNYRRPIVLLLINFIGFLPPVLFSDALAASAKFWFMDTKLYFGVTECCLVDVA